jgi:hypothetical protein
MLYQMVRPPQETHIPDTYIDDESVYIGHEPYRCHQDFCTVQDTHTVVTTHEGMAFGSHSYDRFGGLKRHC